jgi:hypothetical protein
LGTPPAGAGEHEAADEVGTIQRDGLGHIPTPIDADDL